MRITSNREERRNQKEILKGIFADYDAKRHDAFVVMYNGMLEKEKTNNYMVARGI